MNYTCELNLQAAGSGFYRSFRTVIEIVSVAMWYIDCEMKNLDSSTSGHSCAALESLRNCGAKFKAKGDWFGHVKFDEPEPKDPKKPNGPKKPNLQKPFENIKVLAIAFQVIMRKLKRMDQLNYLVEGAIV